MFRNNYKDGAKEGPQESYFENGQLSIIGNCNDGVVEGPWEEYDKSGELKSRGIYKNGQLVLDC
jgi:antitoxin component YwqK of YwqJK toxin-antitoxin module